MREKLHDHQELLVSASILGLGFAAIFGANFAGGRIADSTYGAAKAKQLVEESGLQHPHLLETDRFLVSFDHCDSSDLVEYDFSAETVMGNEVEVAVCRGLFKESTVRGIKP
jgi:hypothetical protein